MISVTRQTTAFAIILLLTTILLCTVRVYINPFDIEVAESEFMPRWWDALLSGLLLFVAAIIINRTTVKIGLFGGFSALPVSVFGFLACGVLVSPNMLTATATALMMTFGILFLLRSMQFVGEKESLFTGALMFGLLPIIYPPAVTFALIVPIAMFIAPLNIRQAIIITTGYLLPLLGASYLNWYLGGEITGLATSIWEHLFIPSATLSLETLPILTFAIVVTIIPLLLYGIMQGIYNRYAMLVPLRKSIQIAIWLLIIGIASLFLVPGCGITIIPTIAAPATIIASFALDKMEGKWANWFYIAIVTLVVIHLVFY